MVRVRTGGLGHRTRSTLATASALGLVCLTTLPAAAAGTDPTVANAEWALTALHAADARNISHGTGVIVAVVDSGVDPSQPDLQGSLVPGASFVNGVQGTNTNDTSSDYHGTDVAAIIAAHTHIDANGDQAGMVGLATQAKIMPVRDGDDSSQSGDIALSVRYAADHGAQVINISEGSYGVSSELSSAINYALSKGIVVVAASGNDAESGNATSAVASAPGVINVASQEQDGTMDPQSHYGSDVSVAAPGFNIEEPGPNGTYNQASGTSLAAPWVSGEAAMLIQIHPTWTNGQIVSAIVNSASGNGTRLNDHAGYGLINPLAALQAAASVSTSNPLGGPSAVFGASTGTTTTAPTAPASSPSTTSPVATTGSAKSTNVLFYLVVGIAILVVIGIVVFLITRGKGKSGPGSTNGGGGGGGNGFYPPQGPPNGGQQAQPPSYQQPPAYKAPQQPPRP